MAKHGKNADPRDATREIVDLSAFRKTASPVFEDETESEEERLERLDQEEAEEDDLKKRKIPKAVYRVGAILLALILFLAVWVNRDRLSLDGAAEWIKLQFVGTGEGDGFPVAVTGSSVLASNFSECEGNVLVLSDTALTLLNSTGRELLSLRHSLNKPVLRENGGMALLYNSGSVGYTLLSGAKTLVEGSSEQDILVGAVSHSGRFALGVQGSDGASELFVYQKNGDLQFHYLFAKDYITAIALNYDGTHGAVCTVGGEEGELKAKVTVFDFNQPEPISSFDTRDNLLLDASWTEGGDLYAVGSSALLSARSSDYAFTEYSYEGRQLTAYCLDQGRAFLSISAYEHAGPCTLLAFRGTGEPVRIESPVRIVSLSAWGGTVGALAGGDAVFYDSATGEELGRIDAGNDAKSLALENEGAAYVLGVSEVRLVGPEG